MTVTGRNGDRFAFIADSTGIKQHNRGEWMQKKWGLSRGFVKLYALVNADTNAIRVTDDSKADAPMFLELLDDALDGIGDGADVSVLGDGAYGSRKNIAGCAERGVTPNLNITSGTKGTSRTWAEAVGQQLGGGSGSQVDKLSQAQRKANREKWKNRIWKKMDSRDRLFCV